MDPWKILSHLNNQIPPYKYPYLTTKSAKLFHTKSTSISALALKAKAQAISVLTLKAQAHSSPNALSSSTQRSLPKILVSKTCSVYKLMTILHLFNPIPSFTKQAYLRLTKHRLIYVINVVSIRANFMLSNRPS